MKENTPKPSEANGIESSSEYNMDGRIFIVEPRFKKNSKETVGTLLLKLMKQEAEQG